MSSDSYPIRGWIVIALWASVGFSIWQANVVGTQKDKIAELQAAITKNTQAQALAKAVQGPSMEIQRKCSEDARKWFAGQEYPQDANAQYVNHYSTRLNRCFVDVQTAMFSKQGVLADHMIIDALENKNYALMLQHSQPTQRLQDVDPSVCQVAMESGDRLNCSSETQFKTLIKAFMEG